MPDVTRLPRPRVQSSPPEWAQVLRTFYSTSFDTSSPESFVESVEAFCALEPDEQAFHQAHLAYRQVQALDDIYGCLRRIEAGLPTLDSKALGALRNLPVMRKALVVIARGQRELLEALESGVLVGGGADSVSGDEEDEDQDDEQDSDLADAVDADEMEEEDHGMGSTEALIPEVLAAGTARPVEFP